MGTGNKLGFFRVQNDNWCPHALVLGEKLGILWDQDNNRCPRVINQFWNMVGKRIMDLIGIHQILSTQDEKYHFTGFKGLNKCFHIFKCRVLSDPNPQNTTFTII